MKTAGSISALLALVVAAAGCGRPDLPMTTMAPKGDLAAWMYSLFIMITWWDALIFAVVLVTFFLAIFWFSTRTGDPGEPSDVESNLLLELAWTVIPSLILIFITVPTVRAIIATQPSQWSADTMLIKVVGHQWWWEFEYPEFHIKTANEIHIPAGKQIHFKLLSADVIHSFWVPQIGGKRDVVPGQDNQITLVATVPGYYYGQCVEYCGTSHANMRLRVTVDTPADFEKWKAAQLAPPITPADGEAAAGAKLFAGAPCAICHEVRGITGFSKQYTGGFRAPDLTHFGSRRTLAGATLDNTPQNVANWLMNPEEMKPGAQMPALGLRGKELSELVAYLESLK